ncbi:glucan 1,3-beta-glucosidase, putative [Phytophthora infestans T30-4]|uniref:glucan 1,3-beta-glucosidase n=1 Tax=Phytophthora infestans (strain T30-4) TaxID=403677 RepID=D0NUH5_PHYIT|nr:glucan 1,3-beta-glucosidase, putative [Phytophthora infestans T30-4]EEY65321.1 glucan 1,3-beta-glucosidase, putative [Phytophthora infestans T30-4]|eukprot:XP_002897184.1 glucan 1,3-beta-glucosidase, putative [Phytophthora infestans T30-4]
MQTNLAIFTVLAGLHVAALCSADASPSSNSTLEASTGFTHVRAGIRDGSIRSRGVNLGGWLVAEHWMTADAAFWQGVKDHFANSGEYTSISKASSPDNIRTKLGEHHAAFITEDDIAQIATAGLNTVRVPLGFWILGYDNFDPSSQHEWQVYTRGTIAYLDQLIRYWAKKHNVAVLLSLHAAKGSQNGADHSSPASPGHPLWSQYSENVANTIEVARFLADRYRGDEAFLGIGLLNEPNGSTDEKVLYQYYKDAYQAVRSTGSDCVLSIMPMLQKQSPDEMVGFMEAPEFTNVWVEWHPYFIWGYEHTPDDQLVNVAVKQEYRGRVDKWNARPGHNRLFIGEWSVATASNMRRTNADLFYTFAMEQLKVHEAAEGGWTLWSWKASAGSNRDVEDWSLQKLLADDRLGRILRNYQ